METFIECVPCLVRQTVDAIRVATDDQRLQERLLRGVLQTISEMDLNTSPPVMTQEIHRFIRERTSVKDPYRKEKSEFNRIALELYPGLKSMVKSSVDPLKTAVKLAIAANVIDLGVNSDLGEMDISRVLEEALDLPFCGDVEAFRDSILGAERILYLMDNAGEIVFDRLLIEQLPAEKITACVRGFPILNDATRTDAEAVGLTKMVTVIDNGSDAPGTVLNDCSQTLRLHFEHADLVISKGQGNYETLSEVRKNIYFLFKAKCPVVSRDIGCESGSLVLRKATGRS